MNSATKRFIMGAIVRCGDCRGKVVATGPKIFIVIWDTNPFKERLEHKWDDCAHIVLDIPDLLPLTI